MPRKPKASAAPERNARISGVDRGEIEKNAEILGLLAAQLEALAEQMKENSIDEFEMDGLGLIDRGIDQIERYINNVNTGITRARQQKLRAGVQPHRARKK